MTRAVDQYVVNGVRVPSVTEVLTISGIGGPPPVDYETLERARERGQETHVWTDLEDRGFISSEDLPDFSIEGYVSAYRRFRAECGFELIASEHVVVSERYRYAGTLDRLAYLRELNRPEEAWTLDIKCVALVTPATRLQVAAYQLPAGTSRGGSVQLAMDGSYRLREYSGRDDLHDWLAALRVAHFLLREGMAHIPEG